MQHTKVMDNCLSRLQPKCAIPYKSLRSNLVRQFKCCPAQSTDLKICSRYRRTSLSALHIATCIKIATAIYVQALLSMSKASECYELICKEDKFCFFPLICVNILRLLQMQMITSVTYFLTRPNAKFLTCISHSRSLSTLPQRWSHHMSSFDNCS